MGHIIKWNETGDLDATLFTSALFVMAGDPANTCAEAKGDIKGDGCTPDMKTMFVNIPHPGEVPSNRSEPADPSRFSTWPSGVKGARPRSATVVIGKNDGGLLGT